MKVKVFVTPKATVLDPQGAAVNQAMHSLGYTNTSNVRVGKTITFEVNGGDSLSSGKSSIKLCEDLLSNPVIEDYTYEIEA